MDPQAIEAEIDCIRSLGLDERRSGQVPPRH
jgi:hypothetical protein